MNIKQFFNYCIFLFTINCSFGQINKQEKEALKQFIGFCKIQIETEDPRYKYATGYTYIILPALNIDSPNIKKSDIINKLDEVLTNNELRKLFLRHYAKLSNNDFDMLFMIIRPSNNDNRYFAKVSSKQAKILTNYILKNYSNTKIQSKESVSDSITEKPIIYSNIEKEASFQGDLMAYISSHVESPKVENLDNRINQIIVNSNITVNSDGKVIINELKTKIKIKSEFSFDSNEIMDLSTKYSKLYEFEVLKLFDNMPNWNPAIANGKNINQSKIIPITFQVGTD